VDDDISVLRQKPHLAIADAGEIRLFHAGAGEINYVSDRSAGLLRIAHLHFNVESVAVQQALGYGPTY
jgi:hypothetical protein